MSVNLQVDGLNEKRRLSDDMHHKLRVEFVFIL